MKFNTFDGHPSYRERTALIFYSIVFLNMYVPSQTKISYQDVCIFIYPENIQDIVQLDKSSICLCMFAIFSEVFVKKMHSYFHNLSVWPIIRVTKT